MRSIVQILCVVAVLVGAFVANAAQPNCPGWRDPVGAKVIGGKQTKLSRWPSQAALRLSKPNAMDALFICGGTAIASDWVMTAAHCFDDIQRQGDGRYVSNQRSLSEWALDVVLGADDLAKAGVDNVYLVAEVKIREGYQRNAAAKQGYDIALVHLARPWTGPIATLSLNGATDPPDPDGAWLTAAGFGLTESALQGGDLKQFVGAGGTVSAGSLTLQQVELPMVGTDQCAGRWKDSLVGKGQICAGFDGGRRQDTCEGDSGGPLVLYDAKGCPIHVGLVSWGAVDCGKPKMYGVYTRVSYHAQWLRDHVPGINASTDHPVASSDLTPAEFVAQVAALTSPRSGQSSISVRGGAIAEVGGSFVFEARSNVAGRLIIIDVNADGVATQIFPNEYVLQEDKSLISAGQPVVVPGPGYGFDHFRADPPLGKGRLIALVVPPDFPVTTTVNEATRTKGFKPERSTVGYFMNLMQQIRDHVATRSLGATLDAAWAVASSEYEIVAVGKK
jgi:secreted trypsin-like serine protease